MTFAEIQNAVIANAGEEPDRAAVKTYINFRLAWIFDAADWTFAKGTDAVTVTAGSQLVTGVAADFAVALGLWNAEGTPLVSVKEYDDFASAYIGTGNSASGKPEAFTVLGTSIFVGPTSSETSTGYLLAYEKAATALVADADVPNIPAGYHMALVHGAKAEFFKLSNVPLAGAFEEDFSAAIDLMKNKYLVSDRSGHPQVPAYRL